jgi:archaellum component FlaC
MNLNAWTPIIVALITGPIMWVLIRFDRRNTEQHNKAMEVHETNQKLLHVITTDVHQVKLSLGDVKDDFFDVKNDLSHLKGDLSHLKGEVHSLTNDINDLQMEDKRQVFRLSALEKVADM